ncbi:MAG: tRNA (N(6)-L-threonylcarbamoyladenosine(37)-C(2))-methylthiotransferase MtaB [Bacteroidales bacterium]|jgi:threonylcarbamoyladenosine tRNA methylthiotransferase MtaB
MSKNVAFVTLGCKLNFSETSTLAREFVKNGYVKVLPSKNADIYVINTCTVTEHADKKCRNIIRKIHKNAPKAIIAVTGCYAQLKPDEILKMEGVDLVLGSDKKGDLFQIVSKMQRGVNISMSCEINKIETIFPAYSSGERTRSFLKLQDGCDYHCSYCTIPLARGKSRNVPIEQLVRQAEEIALMGIKEIVLTGVNTGDFGKTTGESFLDLLKSLNNVEGIQRYRISSIEPNLLTEEIVDWIAKGNKFLPHFHIPLQSGCNKILAAMRRRYNVEMFADKVQLIRSKMENVFFGIDVIVGFPGETDKDFEDTYNFLCDIKPAFLHVFPYSRRANTFAAEMPDQVREIDKSSRVARLTALSEELHYKFCEANVGREEEVLFESTKKGGLMFGYTRNYIRVERPYDKLQIGKIVKVTI